MIKKLLIIISIWRVYESCLIINLSKNDIAERITTFRGQIFPCHIFLAIKHTPYISLHYP